MEGKCGEGKLKAPQSKSSFRKNNNEFASEEEEIRHIQEIILNGGNIDLPATAAGPTVPTILSAPETEQLTPEEQTIKSLVKGNIAFNVPPEISIDEVAHIQLLLDLEKSQSQLKQQITVQGEQHSAQIAVYKRMFAHLTGTDFIISNVTPELQLLTRGSTTKWQWEAKPSTEGVHALHLAVSIAIQVDGETTYKLIESFDRVIKVKVSGISKMSSFFENNWQWLWATFLVPIAAWFWKKRQVAG
ncbi:hypothetical protein [Candidatus Colwellia aromaticivorans]|uniref:hypothetical protein n=1 Tax=Candidatus Colwellia aromaticivorans TaxID=2267621 RepID=UPI000DF29C40|nr:hypothetical protein [Candidatus Colwellia aromaticivorans]